MIIILLLLYSYHCEYLVFVWTDVYVSTGRIVCLVNSIIEAALHFFNTAMYLYSSFFSYSEL